MIHVADYYPAYTGALSSYKSSRRHAFCWYSGAVVGLGGHFGSESMSKTRIFITPQLVHSTALMVLLGYIDYHPSLASCATPDPTYHHLPTTFHHQPINFDRLFDLPCARTHLIYGPIPPSTHHPITLSPPHGHPISGPRGCYVHTWNGRGGLCLPSLYWVLLHVSCCSIVVNCAR